jgi:hypothetical protein
MLFRHIHCALCDLHHANLVNQTLLIIICFIVYAIALVNYVVCKRYRKYILGIEKRAANFPRGREPRHEKTFANRPHSLAEHILSAQ